MNTIVKPIAKAPALKPAEDYYRLRREGIGLIEALASDGWTDYNEHDPGITVLEALCYALTDLAYRAGWPVEDLLAPAPGQPGRLQAFFTARTILTINPWTVDDYRRLLIDLEPVRNAWLSCRRCACETPLFAWCDPDDALQLGYRLPPGRRVYTPAPVTPRGLYDVLLELEHDPVYGDLNDRKLVREVAVYDGDHRPHLLTVEARFPALEWTDPALYALFAAADQPVSVVMRRFTPNRNDGDIIVDTDLLVRGWRGVFYTSLDVTLLAGSPAPTVRLDNVALRVYGDETARGQVTVEPDAAAQLSIRALLEEAGTAGLTGQFRGKLAAVDRAVRDARAALHGHRNLDEDFCRVDRVEVEDVAVCADVEVAPDADIERVQAHIWFEIEQYFNPPIRFYRLDELRDAGVPVEDIFNGPPLESGFIRQDELEAAGLRVELRVSDLLNRLMDLKAEGLVTLNNLLLTKYDAEGNAVRGAADRGLDAYRADKVSAEWTLAVTENHQPRLYHRLSRFLFYKNGLPFLPRLDEAYDTLTQLRGEAERPRLRAADRDLPVPAGTFRDPEAYFPVQYSLPPTYGVGFEGLPDRAGPARRGQARQLKAYLLVFEQLLANSLAQTARVGDLFALDPRVRSTYFTRRFDDATIRDADRLYAGLDDAALGGLAETPETFLKRRNRLLDHLLARFGEQFSEYALALNNLAGQQLTLERLIADKLAFLRACPDLSANRARAFNYRAAPADPGNLPGLRRRLARLLGYAGTRFQWGPPAPAGPGLLAVPFALVDEYGRTRLAASGAGPTVAAADATAAYAAAYELLGTRLRDVAAWTVVPAPGGFQVVLSDAAGVELARTPTVYEHRSEADDDIGELMLLAPHSARDSERFIVVEHLLLRPKFPGDALYPVCSDRTCTTCDVDPYAFRLTFVMPGWAEPFDANLELRAFANRTIQRETPSHLLPKICWVDNRGFVDDPCDPVITRVLDLLADFGLAGRPDEPVPDAVCTCALAMYRACGEVFREWFLDKQLRYFREPDLRARLAHTFAVVDLTQLGCTLDLTADPALLPALQALFLDHFTGIALSGWQFEKFEHAWQAWLVAQAAVEDETVWAERRLHARVGSLLGGALDRDARCACATAILAGYGERFQAWIGEQLDAGRQPSEFGAVPEPGFTAATLCPEHPDAFAPEAADAVNAYLRDQYRRFAVVSYWLTVVVERLAALRSIYPPATLHDCDDGSDDNPVRLGATALGN